MHALGVKAVAMLSRLGPDGSEQKIGLRLLGAFPTQIEIDPDKGRGVKANLPDIRDNRLDRLLIPVRQQKGNAAAARKEGADVRGALCWPSTLLRQLNLLHSLKRDLQLLPTHLDCDFPVANRF